VTELEWERCIELEPMLRFLHSRVSVRKLQLFAVACCRQHWELFCPQSSRQIVNAVELFADGIGTEAGLDAALNTPLGPIPQGLSYGVARCSNTAAVYTARCRGESAAGCAEVAADSTLSAVSLHRDLFEDEYSRDPHPERYKQIALLYDIVGNPFRPAAFDPNWLTSIVVALARRAYQSRDWSVMPILADALQDAGCDNEELLNHCRDTSLTHVRGCWVVDRILEKE
jgi:hypothetical protein